MSKSEDLLSGLEYFDGDQKGRPEVDFDSALDRVHSEIAKGTIQVLNIKLPDGIQTVLIKSINVGDNGQLDVEFVPTTTDYTSDELWPYVKDAISIQIDMINNQIKPNIFRRIINKIKRLSWKKP